MKVSITLKTMNLSYIADALGKEQEELMMEAIRVLVRTAASRVPVDTGTARATWLELANAVNVFIPINPKSKRKGYGIDVGMAASNYSLETKNLETTFTWGMDVKHYALNEQYNTVPSAPWQSLSYGETKMKDYILNLYGKIFVDIIKRNKKIVERVY